MRTIAGAVVVLLIPSLAWAGGEEYPDNGAQALSRGGAFTAKADDLTALQYNVAGLAKVRGTRLLLSVNFVNADASFQRAGSYPVNPGAPQPYDNAPYPKVSNSSGLFVAPMIMAASDFGLRHWTFAGGIYGPSAAGTLTLPRTVMVDGNTAPSPQRYDIVDEDLFVAYPTLGVAYRPLEMISVGAAFHWVYMRTKFHQITYVPPADPNVRELPVQDYDTSIDVTDSFEPAFSVGALARPIRNIEIGANYRSGVDFDAQGTAIATVQPGASITPMYDNGKNAVVDHFKTGLPFILRGGIRYIFESGNFEKGDIEADFTYEGWSKIFDITTAVSGVNPEPKVVRAPHRFNDTYSGRVGGQYNWDTMLGVWSARVGFYYDSAAVPDEWTRLDFRAWDHLGYTAGIGWQWAGITANVGAAYVYMPERNVTNSQLRQPATLGGSPSDPTFAIVGNGIYDSSYTTLTFSVEYKFDPFR